MSRILITSGPTRQYLDPVRYLTNASSGRMGAALATAAIECGHDVVVVSGPVHVPYPASARVIPVISTEEMLAACSEEFPACEGLIASAAPCDYRPQQIAEQKIAKSGQPLTLHLLETPDIVATLAASRRATQWIVGFALETNDRHLKALVKLQKKSCNLIVLNGPQAIDSEANSVEIMDREGRIVGQCSGPKIEVARGILACIQQTLLQMSE
jgi:phosphopantothenoylcysteine decarboxylase/phosphopantothenate--cysteine ligase